MLQRRLLLFCVGLFTIFFNQAFAFPDPFIKTKDGIIIYTDPSVTGVSRAVKLDVIADHIIRVVASPGREFIPSNSLITVYTKNPALTWTSTSDKEKVTLKTKSLTAVVQIKSGVVSFFDASGKKILSEKGIGGRSFEPVIVEGQRSYAVKQTFQTAADDAYYGLGQHQDDVFNYKGQQAFLFQNNTEVGVPFLVSKEKN